MLHRLWLLLGLWLLCACALAAVPERPRFRIIGNAQGLPSTEIFALARDHDGYLWIATADGLARYDGVDMRVWRHDAANPAGLPGNNVQALMVDADDRIWVAVEGGGISMLGADRQRFVHFRQATHPAMGSDDIWAFANQGHAIWFGTYAGGLYRMDPGGGIVAYRHSDDAEAGLPSDTIVALAVDAGGVLWIGTDKGLAYLQGGRIRSAKLPGNDGTAIVYSLSVLPDGLWVGTSAGIWRRDAAGKWWKPAWSKMFERPNAVMEIVRDHDGSYWLGSQRGLWRQRGEEPPVPQQTGGPDIPRSVKTLLLQPDGALWAPLAGFGVGYLRSDWRQSARYSGAADGLHGALYRALAPARLGGFWVAGYNGVVERLASDGSIERLDDASQARLRDSKLVAVTEDLDGRVWLAPRAGLLRINQDGAIDEWHAQDERDPIPASQIDQVRIGADGSLWVAAPGGGVQQRDVASGRVLLDIPAGEPGGLGLADTEALVIAPDGDVWIAGSEGVAQLDRVHRRFKPVLEMGRNSVSPSTMEMMMA